MIILIIIGAVIIFWIYRNAGQKTEMAPEQAFRVYVLHLMKNTVEYNAREAPSPVLQGTYVLGGLVGCKKHLEDNAHKLALKYKLPVERVNIIIQVAYDQMYRTYIK